MKLLKKVQGPKEVGIAARQFQGKADLRSDADEKVFKALFLQEIDIERDRLIEPELYAAVSDKAHIPFDRFRRQAKPRNHMFHHSAGRLPLFKNRHLKARSGEEIRRGQPGRAPADDRNLRIRLRPGLLLSSAIRPPALFRRHPLDFPDFHGIVVIQAGAVSHARVIAYITRDIGQGVFGVDQIQRLGEPLLAYEPDVLRDVLPDRAGPGARRGITVQQRKLLPYDGRVYPAPFFPGVLQFADGFFRKLR